MTATGERKRSIRWWVFWLCFAIPVGAAVIYLLIWFGPDMIARHDIGNVTGPLRVLRLQQARDAARGRLLTLGAGLFAAGALVYTARNFTLSRRAVELTLRTVELTEQGQVTDRYTKAIEQLGSDKLDVRIGAVYALERIARDSAIDHPTVMEVLAAFIREHSREPLPPPPGGEPGDYDYAPGTRPDVQAAVTVIGRRNPGHDRQRLKLHSAELVGADLAHAILAGAILAGADLSGANLIGAALKGASLRGAYLTDADLIDANLTDADLGGAILRDANLRAANLGDATLARAVLAGANLTRADLRGATLDGADLAGANLTRADLTGANLTGALWPPDAVVPTGWQRDTDSGRLKRADTNTGGTATD